MSMRTGRRPSIYHGSSGLTPRMKRAKIALKPGQVRCEECMKGVRLRADGQMMSHRFDGIPCLASNTTRYLRDGG